MPSGRELQLLLGSIGQQVGQTLQQQQERRATGQESLFGDIARAQVSQQFEALDPITDLKNQLLRARLASALRGPEDTQDIKSRGREKDVESLIQAEEQSLGIKFSPKVRNEKRFQYLKKLTVRPTFREELANILNPNVPEDSESQEQPDFSGAGGEDVVSDEELRNRLERKGFLKRK